MKPDKKCTKQREQGWWTVSNTVLSHKPMYNNEGNKKQSLAEHQAEERKAGFCIIGQGKYYWGEQKLGQVPAII